MLKRKVYEDLLKWKKEANGKALKAPEHQIR